jgi:hypothetical protein
MTPSNEPRLLVRGMQRAQNVHSLRAMRIFVWAKDMPSCSPFKTRLRCPIKAPTPDLQQALQRADMRARFSSARGPLNQRTGNQALFENKTPTAVYSWERSSHFYFSGNCFLFSSGAIALF